MKRLLCSKSPNYLAPTFSFINACETVTQNDDPRGIYNWARAMADCSGRACLGTLWSVRDYNSTLFSTTFYKNLLEKNVPR